MHPSCESTWRFSIYSRTLTPTSPGKVGARELIEALGRSRRCQRRWTTTASSTVTFAPIRRTTMSLALNVRTSSSSCTAVTDFTLPGDAGAVPLDEAVRSSPYLDEDGRRRKDVYGVAYVGQPEELGPKLTVQPTGLPRPAPVGKTSWRRSGPWCEVTADSHSSRSSRSAQTSPHASDAGRIARRSSRQCYAWWLRDARYQQAAHETRDEAREGSGRRKVV